MKTGTLLIGGGLCGLTVARMLTATGADFQLIDARARLGGRILGLPALSDPRGGIPSLDAGPAWVWPGQERVAALVDDLGLTLFGQYQTGNTVFEDHDGQIRRDIAMALNPGSLRVEGGLARLIAALAAALPDDRISTEWAATAIERTGEGYRVSVRTPQGDAAIDAESVVVALPPRLAADQLIFRGW